MTIPVQQGHGIEIHRKSEAQTRLFFSTSRPGLETGDRRPEAGRTARLRRRPVKRGASGLRLFPSQPSLSVDCRLSRGEAPKPPPFWHSLAPPDRHDVTANCQRSTTRHGQSSRSHQLDTRKCLDISKCGGGRNSSWPCRIAPKPYLVAVGWHGEIDAVDWRGRGSEWGPGAWGGNARRSRGHPPPILETP